MTARLEYRVIPITRCKATWYISESNESVPLPFPRMFNTRIMIKDLQIREQWHGYTIHPHCTWYTYIHNSDISR